MEAIKRRRSLSVQEWSRVMRRFATSGITVSAFCRREGLNEGSFYRWRPRVRAASMNRNLAVQESLELPPPQPSSFVDLGALHDASASPIAGGGTLDLRLDLGGGLSLHLVRR